MSREESLEAIRKLLKARDEEELSQLIGLYLPAIDGTFFAVLNESVEQLKRENKHQVARALEALGTHMLKMKTLI
ncbi:MAG TPA: hypothetical protein G4O02_13125 [Caldilineae bacterium]|nr:hypothetical protein [Caldilineae bacterium]